MKKTQIPPIGKRRLWSLPFAPLDLGKTVSVTDVSAPLHPSAAIFFTSKIETRLGIH